MSREAYHFSLRKSTGGPFIRSGSGEKSLTFLWPRGLGGTQMELTLMAPWSPLTQMSLLIASEVKVYKSAAESSGC